MSGGKSRIVDFLTRTADEAGDVLLRHFGRVKDVRRKRNEGIVTEADKAAERVILKKILRNFPDSSIVTEESGEYQGSRSLQWFIDPLDGTTNYAHGFPWFCVSIGVHEEGRPLAGVVFQPISRECYTGEAGKGAWLNGKRLRVSGTSDLRDALLGTGFYYSKGARLTEEVSIFRRVNEKVLGVRRPGSAALDLALVASGRYDGFWERGLKCWDVAAGYLLVTEAGGKVTSYRGKPTDVFSSEALATNTTLHRKMVSLLSPSRH